MAREGEEVFQWAARALGDDASKQYQLSACLQKAGGWWRRWSARAARALTMLREIYVAKSAQCALRRTRIMGPFVHTTHLENWAYPVCMCRRKPTISPPEESIKQSGAPTTRKYLPQQCFYYLLICCRMSNSACPRVDEITITDEVYLAKHE